MQTENQNKQKNQTKTQKPNPATIRIIYTPCIFRFGAAGPLCPHAQRLHKAAMFSLSVVTPQHCSSRGWGAADREQSWRSLWWQSWSSGCTSRQKRANCTSRLCRGICGAKVPFILTLTSSRQQGSALLFSIPTRKGPAKAALPHSISDLLLIRPSKRHGRRPGCPVISRALATLDKQFCTQSI